MNGTCRVKLGVGLVALVLGVIACGVAALPVREIAGEPLLTPTATATGTSTPTATSTPTPTASASVTSLSLRPSATPTSSPTPTPIPTSTLKPSPAPSPLLPTPSPQSPTETATLTPEPVVPTDTPSVENEDEPAKSLHRYFPVGEARPELSQPCPGCPRAPGYIIGRVVDAGGNPLAGVRLVCYNDWHRYPVVGTKGGGEYDFLVLQAEATWYVVVLDEADQSISPEVPVHFNPVEACWYRLDWQRVD